MSDQNTADKGHVHVNISSIHVRPGYFLWGPRSEAFVARQQFNTCMGCGTWDFRILGVTWLSWWQYKVYHLKAIQQRRGW